MDKGALGKVMEADIRFDFPSPSWIEGWGKEYTPGQGMAFGLGNVHQPDRLALPSRLLQPLENGETDSTPRYSHYRPGSVPLRPSRIRHWFPEGK